ncbi:ABC-type amino acid transport substrate-binding protein [Streptomyces tendae]
MNAHAGAPRVREGGSAHWWRRLRAGLRGWGGVGAMASVCALAVTAALLLPLSQPAGDGAPAGHGVTRAVQARADDCEDPQDRSLSPSGGDGKTPTIDAVKAREDRRLVVGVDTNSYRWGYLDPNNPSGDLEGFDIDLVHRIAEDLLGDRDAVRFKAIPTSRRIEAIQKGEVDMVVRTMTITCDRLEQVAFSAPYFVTGQQVLAPKTSQVTGFDKSLADRKVCSARGSTAYDNLEAGRKEGVLPDSTDIRTTVPNQLDCLVKLQLGGGRRGRHGRRARGEPGGAGPGDRAQGRAVHGRVLRSGDEKGIRRSGPPGQPDPGGLRRGRWLGGVVREVAAPHHGHGRQEVGVGDPARGRLRVSGPRPRDGTHGTHDLLTELNAARGDRWASRTPPGR